MTLLDPTRYQDPLDPLRRFIPTPLRTQFRVGSTTVVVQTNDFSLLPALPLAAPSAASISPASHGSWFGIPMPSAFSKNLCS